MREKEKEKAPKEVVTLVVDNITKLNAHKEKGALTKLANGSYGKVMRIGGQCNKEELTQTHSRNQETWRMLDQMNKECLWVDT